MESQGIIMAKTNYSTYIAIKNRVLAMMKEEVFEDNKLPSEPLLAQKMGISLVTLREALLMLALEGYITKRHGSGNYFHRSALDFENRSIYFADSLGKEGYEVSFEVLERKFITADSKLKKLLKISNNEKFLRTKFVVKADGNPAVYTLNYIPVRLLTNKNVEEMCFEYLHEVIWKFCERSLAHALNDYQPVSVNKELSEVLQMKRNAPVISCLQTYYDIQDERVTYNHHFFNPNYYTLRTLQNWDLNQ